MTTLGHMKKKLPCVVEKKCKAASTKTKIKRDGDRGETLLLY